MKIIRIIKICFLIILAMVVCNFTYEYMMNRYGGENKETRQLKYFMQYDEEFKPNPSYELVLTLQKNTNWDNLFITQKFKEKYKNRYGIIKDLNNYNDVYGGDEEVKNKEWVSCICLEKKKSIIDVLKDSPDIYTEYMFECFVDDNGNLDDIKMLRKVDRDQTTGQITKIYYDEIHEKEMIGSTV